MNLGDYYIGIVIGVLFAGVSIYFFMTMFSRKNRGVWDQKAELIGKLHREKYKYRDQVENAQEFLLQDSQKNYFWPAHENARGYDLVSSKNPPFWRSCGVSNGDSKDLYFTYEIPQRNDGADFFSPEILFVSLNDDSTNLWQIDVKKSAQVQARIGNWDLFAVKDAVANEYVDSDFAQWLMQMRGFKAIHIVGKNVTLVVPKQSFDQSSIMLYPRLAAASSAICEFLPKEYWD